MRAGTACGPPSVWRGRSLEETKAHPMKFVVCPHCKTHRILTEQMPQDVVVVVLCPSCQELMVLFRNKVIGVSRKVLEPGTIEERAAHLAPVIARLLEAGMLSVGSEDAPEEPPGAARADKPEQIGRRAKEATSRPISDREIERFLRFELKCIDDASYFKRHFG